MVEGEEGEVRKRLGQEEEGQVGQVTGIVEGQVGEVGGCVGADDGGRERMGEGGELGEVEGDKAGKEGPEAGNGVRGEEMGA